MQDERRQPDPPPDDRSLMDPSERNLPPPLAALAEAMRVNAEALRRIDATQRRMAETIERSDKSQQVIASTRALNATFRGLSEIQRGLLDAVVRRGGGGRTVLTPLIVLAVAIFAGLVSVLLYQQWAADRTVSRAVYEEARREGEGLARQNRDLGARLASQERDAGQRREAFERDRERLQSTGTELERRIEALEGELETKSARLESYLAVKAQADLAGALQIRNMSLEREVRDLQERLAGLRRERESLYGYFGDKLLDLRDGDPEAVKAMARKLGVYRDPAPPPAPDGPIHLAGSSKRLLVRQLNRLFPDAEEAYDVIDVGAISDGWRLQDVTLTRSRRGRLVNSFRCKELTIVVDVEQDTVEVLLKEGYMTNTGRPSEQIPLGRDGHSIFLPEAGVKAWLSRVSAHVAVGEKGRLTWKTAPS
ncbi:MAG: hypothetical protein ACYTEZ_01580 [Planctomycetota bacterium]|jgi:hypothetical protein